MPMHSAYEMPKPMIASIKMALKQQLISRWKNAHKGTTPAKGLNIREIAPGDESDITSPAFVDFDFATAATAGLSQWLIDTTDQGTAGKLKNFIAANEKINADTWLGVMGVFDNGPTSGVPLTDVFGTVPTGALDRLRFRTSGQDLGYFDTEHLYAFPSMSGFTDTPQIWDETDDFEVQGAWNYVSADQPVGLRGYVLEPNGKKFTRDEHVNPLDMGMDPIFELTPEEIFRRKKIAENQLVNAVINDGHVSSVTEFWKKWYLREILVGTNTATDKYDVAQHSDVVSGGQYWAQDDDETTAGDLSTTMNATAALEDKAYASIFGFFDRTNFPSLCALELLKGAGPVAWWQVEHCYNYPGYSGGMTAAPVLYKENENIDIKWNFSNATYDQFCGPRAFIARPLGKEVNLLS